MPTNGLSGSMSWVNPTVNVDVFAAGVGEPLAASDWAAGITRLPASTAVAASRRLRRRPGIPVTPDARAAGALRCLRAWLPPPGPFCVDAGGPCSAGGLPPRRARPVRRCHCSQRSSPGHPFRRDVPACAVCRPVGQLAPRNLVVLHGNTVREAIWLFLPPIRDGFRGESGPSRRKPLGGGDRLPRPGGS